MLPQFISHVQQQHLFPTGQEVLLAVSGGIDSVVLAHLMHAAGFPFAIAHCNFHLRPDDCNRDEQFVRQLALQYGVPIFVAQFDTLNYARQFHLCVEDAARKLRYDFFEQVRSQQGYAAILTAHHRDDSAETFFINLLRGTGLTGLHGILPVQGHVVRPLLPFGRDEIETYAAAHGLSHVEDATNASLLYRRNQIRHLLLPLLRELQPTADHAIAQTIRHLQSVEQLYNTLLQPLRSQLVHPQPDGTVRIALPMPVQSNEEQLLFELLRPSGFNYATVVDILSSTHSGRQFYSATHHAVLDRQQLIVEPLASKVSHPLPPLRTAQIKNFSYSSLDWKALPPTTALFDADKVLLPLSLRHWREGDRFQPLGMTRGTQLVSDFFSDHKYSLPDKQRQLLLVDAADNILWIVGRRTAHPPRVTPTTTTLLTVSVETDVPTQVN